MTREGPSWGRRGGRREGLWLPPPSRACRTQPPLQHPGDEASVLPAPPVRSSSEPHWGKQVSCWQEAVWGVLAGPSILTLKFVIFLHSWGQKRKPGSQGAQSLCPSMSLHVHGHTHMCIYTASSVLTRMCTHAHTLTPWLPLLSPMASVPSPCPGASSYFCPSEALCSLLIFPTSMITRFKMPQTELDSPICPRPPQSVSPFPFR